MVSWFRRTNTTGSHAGEISGEVWFNAETLPAAAQLRVGNGEPLSLTRDLKGYVVLVDFWDYSCVNCVRTLPYLKTWWERYRAHQFIIIGVHTPEFAFGRDASNVENAVLRFDLKYPIVSDPEYITWQRYHNNVWPRKFLIDSTGTIRRDQRGEGGYQAMEAVIQTALHERDPHITFEEVLAPVRETDHSGAVCYPTTPELYLGVERGRPYQGTALPNSPTRFELPETVPVHQWSLGGTWSLQAEAAVFVGGHDEPGSLLLTYEATHVFAVMRSRTAAGADVIIEHDGQPLRDGRGEDVQLKGDQSIVHVTSDRLYELVRNQTHGQHTLKLTTTTPDVAFHTFTFGSSCIS